MAESRAFETHTRSSHECRAAPAWDPLAMGDEVSDEQLHRHFGWPGYGRWLEG